MWRGRGIPLDIQWEPWNSGKENDLEDLSCASPINMIDTAIVKC